MEPFLDSIISRDKRGANYYGLLVTWGAFIISVLALCLTTVRNEQNISLRVWMAVTGEFLVLLIANIYLVRTRGDSSRIRYIWLLVLLSVASTNSLVAQRVLWGFFLLPVVFSFRYSYPLFTLAVGFISTLWGYFFGFLQIYFGFNNNGYVNMRYVILKEPATIDLRQGFYGIFGPIFESGMIDKKDVYTEYFIQELPSVLMLLLSTWICAILVHKFSNRLQMKMENQKKIQTIEEQKLRELQQKRQIEEITALNTQLKSQQELASTAKQNAEKANAYKTDFVNMMSHEIRTPLNAIIGFTALAKNHQNDEKLVHDYLTKITDSSQYLLSLINEVYDINMIESGQMELQEKEVRIKDIMKNLYSIIVGATNTQNIQFNIDTESIDDKLVLCDPLRFNQAFINLSRSALRFAQPHDTVSIIVSQKDSATQNASCYEFHLSVNNNRISPEMAASQFNESSFKSPEKTRNEYGVGMSAIIAKQIINQMGGSIHVHEGKDTEYVVTLTLQNALEQRDDANQKMDVSWTYKPDGMHILVVEDNELNQEIIATQLESAGFQVDIAKDGLEAVSMIMNTHTGTYNFVLMDVQMPRMDGYEATRIIRSFPDAIKSQIPIIAVSASAMEEDKKNAQKAGMNGHIAKPISLEKLLCEINKILQG